MDTILIVEDDPAMQRVLARLFESGGYGVHVRADGKSALDAVYSTAPTAIVLDLGLPTISGKDVCRQIRRETPVLPIIILTGITDTSEKIALLELGADDYMTKPFSPKELLARVRAAIRRANASNVPER